MSLHTLAQHLQTAGRGDDRVLVHMTPGEVQGLQSLAMAHGGSLTVNPETGLPEAGFLSSILPMVAGLALGPAGAGITFGGLSSAASAGLLVGGASALASGSLQKGLMAGLGAYGGAGMGAGLMGAAPAAAAASVPTVAPAAFTPQAIGSTGIGTATAAAPAAATLPVNPAMAQSAGTAFGMPAPAAPGTIPTATQYTPATAPVAQQVATTATQQGIPSVLQQTGQNMQQAFSGLQELFKDPEKAKQYLGEQKYNLLGAALSASNMEQQKPPSQRRYQIPDYELRREVNPSPQAPGSSGERMWFGADGGMAVENMSQQNAMMDNQKYPMAFQNTSTYAMPSERPISQNVLYPATDAGVTPYSGIATLAEGGAAKDSGTKTSGAPSKLETQTAKNLGISVDKLRSMYGQKVTPPKVETKPAADTTKTTKPVDAATQAGIDKLINDPYAAVNAARADGSMSMANKTAGLLANLPKMPTDLKTATVGGLPSTGTALASALDYSKTYTQPVTANTTTSGTTTGGTTAGDTTGGTTNVSQPTQEQIDAAYKNLKNRFGVSKIGDIKGDLPNDIESLWNSEIERQAAERDALSADNYFQKALSSTDPVIRAAAAQLWTDQQQDIADAQAAKTSAIDNFYERTARTSNSVGSRNLNTFVPEGEKKTVFNPNTGEYEEVGPSEQYKELTYKKGKITATSGWGKDKVIIEPENVQEIWEAVVGRAPTAKEKSDFVGSQMSLDELAAKANKAPDLTMNRTFTDKDLNDQAKFYWGRDMTSGELASFKNAGYNTFKQLRDALIDNEKFVDHLNEINLQTFTEGQKPKPVAATSEEIAEKFTNILDRAPTASELRKFVNNKVSLSDLENALKSSNEYYYTKLLKSPDASKYRGNLNPFTFTGEETADIIAGTGNASGNATGNLAGNISLGGTGISPALLFSNVAFQQQIADFKKQYEEYAPTLGNISQTSLTGNTTSTGTLGGLPTLTGNVSTFGNVATSAFPPIYQPIYQPVPQYSIEGAMQYRSPVTELGLENLYKRLGQTMPDVRTGLSFTPNTGVAAPSAFGNVTPGLVTLQSTAVPVAYTPPTPILPGTTTQVQALSPEEQVLLSKYQQLEQNKTGLAAGGMAMGGYAGGGYNLGDYSDGGRLLKGPGDGVSDSIPASIGDKQPARLADGEFVIPARIVSELGNGSTDAGARQLYAMMDRIQRQRRKTIGKGRVAVDSKASKMLPV